MATDVAMQHSSWVVTVLSGFVIPLALAVTTLAMLLLDERK
jgi:hypothetical protein